MERTDGYISMVNQKYFPLLFSVYFASTILSNAFLLQFSDRCGLVEHYLDIEIIIISFPLRKIHRSTRIITRSERSAVPQSISDSYKGSARNALNVLALLSLIIPSSECTLSLNLSKIVIQYSHQKEFKRLKARRNIPLSVLIVLWGQNLM